MRLEAVPRGEPAAVIGDRERQEMELEVGNSHAGARADEAAGLEMVGRAEAVAAGRASAGRSGACAQGLTANRA